MSSGAAIAASRRRVLFWFRRDLRLRDHEALSAAAKLGEVVPVFIWAPEEEAPWEPGAASRWWLHHSLTSLKSDLAARGSGLVVRRGPSLETLRQLVAETGARRVAWSRLWEPAAARRDAAVLAGLQADGVDVVVGDSLLCSPD